VQWEDGMAQDGQRKGGSPSTRVVERNIEALLAHRQAQEDSLGWQDKLAAKIADFAGNMNFVWLHLAAYGFWVLTNLGVIPGIEPFDPTFVVLAMIASVEAIFLSTFILITQNRMQGQAERRADLNLQVSLLSEHEITRLIKMLTEIGEKMDIQAARAPEIGELKKDVNPENVLETIEHREAQHEREQNGDSDSSDRKGRSA
jgi:uncharacterized membrane protein